MRDDLVGHLLGALDAPDSERLATKLTDPVAGPPLRREMEVLRRATAPLTADRDPFSAPPGLAERTLRMVAEQRADDRNGAPSARPSAAVPSARQPLPRPRHTMVPGDGGERAHRVDGATWIDKAILAATALAACILVFPALTQLADDARRTQSERRLGRLGNALHGYAGSHRRYPSPPDGGPMSRGGLYAPTLVSEHRIVADDGSILTPGSPLAVSGTFRVPSLEELQSSVGTPEFEEMVRSMGGDFGYTLGYRDQAGRLQPLRALHRGHHPLMADAPDESCERSSNHPTGLHHVLYEDGRVDAVLEADLHADDHLFRNHDGFTAAGKDEEDAVIGDSHHQP